jgi:hypothetical protein
VVGVSHIEMDDAVNLVFQGPVDSWIPVPKHGAPTAGLKIHIAGALIIPENAILPPDEVDLGHGQAVEHTVSAHRFLLTQDRKIMVL